MIAGIITGLALRYFYVQQRLRAQEQAELQSRIQALQSRIRPHFLFNSMNIIASLIAVDPETAESVVEDLSELFRASLNDAGNRVSVEEELELCRRYVRIEALRLGDRLHMEWDVSGDLTGLRLPMLTLQPLLENAIYHGVQPLPEGGTITVKMWTDEDNLRVTITNPLPPAQAQTHAEGNKMALDNIRSRLAVLYGDKAELKTGASDGEYLGRAQNPHDWGVCYEPRRRSRVNILIVDDESLARDRLKRIIEDLDGHQVVGEAANGMEAVEQMGSLDADIVLLDIRMPGMDGLETARHLGTFEEPPAVIFCTAYEEHAIEAFDLQAVGYLLKPVRRENVGEALARAQRINRAQMAALSSASDQRRSHISARSRRGIELIPIEDVRFFQADQKYVTVRHQGGETIIDEPLRDLEEEFSDLLLRVHRNALVAVQHIEGVERTNDGHYQIALRGIDDRLDISRRHVATVRRFLRTL